MTRPVVRCRCGHRVLAKEVLRTDLYERPSGREYVYVKFRCKRCKRLGETFVAESRWDWRIFETARNEMSESESDSFAGQAPISAEEILEFHHRLQSVEATADLNDSTLDDESTPGNTSSEPNPTKPRGEHSRSDVTRPDVSRPDAKRDFKNDLKPDLKSEHKEHKGEPKTKPSETGSGDDAARRPPCEG
jgi:hypothetical protein